MGSRPSSFSFSRSFAASLAPASTWKALPPGQSRGPRTARKSGELFLDDCSLPTNTPDGRLSALGALGDGARPARPRELSGDLERADLSPLPTEHYRDQAGLPPHPGLRSRPTMRSGPTKPAGFSPCTGQPPSRHPVLDPRPSPSHLPSAAVPGPRPRGARPRHPREVAHPGLASRGLQFWAWLSPGPREKGGSSITGGLGGGMRLEVDSPLRSEEREPSRGQASGGTGMPCGRPPHRGSDSNR